MENTRVCTKCGEEYPQTKDYFYYNSISNRFKSECKKCSKEYIAKRRKSKEPIRKKKGRPSSVEVTNEGDMECRICGKVYPYTSEYFAVNSGYKSGLETRCKDCRNAYEREKYYKSKPGEYKYQPCENYKKLLEERNKRDEEAYRKLVTEPQDKGIGDKLDTVKLSKGKKYSLKRRKNEKNEYEFDFEGIMVQDTKDLVILRNNKGYCSTYRKYDILCGDYKVTEVRK